MEDQEAAAIMDETEAIPLPEAPSSANVKVWIGGFGVMFTFR